MLKRKPHLALATLALLGLPCLAISHAFTTAAPTATSTAVPAGSAETLGGEPAQTGSVQHALARAAIRRTPPVIPGLRPLPPVPAEQTVLGAVIAVGSSDEAQATRQVAATLPARQEPSPATQPQTEASPQIAKGDLVPQTEAVSPWSVTEVPSTPVAPHAAPPAPVQLTANSPSPEDGNPPVTVEPVEVAGEEVAGEDTHDAYTYGEYTHIELALNDPAPPAPPVEHVPADYDVTSEADLAGEEGETEAWRYDECGCGHYGRGCGRFRCRQKPVVCYHDRPFGWYVRNANQLQVTHGLRDQMVLYHYDFQEGPHADQLSTRGRQQLKKYAQLVETHRFPVVIQPAEGRPELDA
ncbi:MAG: hypothetical protein GTO03_07220, partial [Planctomycetales bacterium]|nr:hypothetical protein [Planctomycetales bacterium]